MTIIESADNVPYWGYAFSRVRDAEAFRKRLPAVIPRTLLDVLAIDYHAAGRLDETGLLDRTFGGIVTEDSHGPG